MRNTNLKASRKARLVFWTGIQSPCHLINFSDMKLNKVVILLNFQEGFLKAQSTTTS